MEKMETAAPAFDKTAASPRLRGVRILLAVTVLLELARQSEGFFLGVGGTVVDARMATLLLTALVFAVWGRARFAILALGVVVLIEYVPWMLLLTQSRVYGLDNAFGSVLKASYFLFPLLAAVAIWLVARKQRLTLAAMLVCAPIFFNLAWLLAAVLLLSLSRD